MSRKGILQILLAVAIFATIGTTAVSAVIADSFQSPMNSYVISDGWRFGQYEGSGLYHAGEDLQAVKYERVTSVPLKIP